MDSLIANLTIEDQAKMQYVKRFIDRLPLPVLEKGDTITLGPMDNQLFQYLLFCLILEYEPPSLPKEVKLQIWRADFQTQSWIKFLQPNY